MFPVIFEAVSAAVAGGVAFLKLVERHRNGTQDIGEHSEIRSEIAQP